jgi:hypothetical protein
MNVPQPHTGTSSEHWHTFSKEFKDGSKVHLIFDAASPSIPPVVIWNPLPTGYPFLEYFYWMKNDVLGVIAKKGQVSLKSVIPGPPGLCVTLAAYPDGTVKNLTSDEDWGLIMEALNRLENGDESRT